MMEWFGKVATSLLLALQSLLGTLQAGKVPLPTMTSNNAVSTSTIPSASSLENVVASSTSPIPVEAVYIIDWSGLSTSTLQTITADISNTLGVPVQFLKAENPVPRTAPWFDTNRNQFDGPTLFKRMLALKGNLGPAIRALYITGDSLYSSAHKEKPFIRYITSQYKGQGLNTIVLSTADLAVTDTNGTSRLEKLLLRALADSVGLPSTTDISCLMYGSVFTKDSIDQMPANFCAAELSYVKGDFKKHIQMATAPEPLPILTLHFIKDGFMTKKDFLSEGAIIADDVITLQSETKPSYWQAMFTIPENADYLSFKYKFTNPGDGTPWLTASFGDTLLFTIDGSCDLCRTDENGFRTAEYLNSFQRGKTGPLAFALHPSGKGPAEVIVKDVTFYTVPAAAGLITKATTYKSIFGFSITLPAGWYMPAENDIPKFYHCEPRQCNESFSVASNLNTDPKYGFGYEKIWNDSVAARNFGATVEARDDLIPGARVIAIKSPSKPGAKVSVGGTTVPAWGARYYVYFNKAQPMMIEAEGVDIEAILATLKLTD